MERKETQTACSGDSKSGILPGCAPLAVPYVPFQQMDPAMYDACEALNRGTLFPGLFLPFRNRTEVTNAADGDLGSLMALAFALYDLGLYLDTHSGDSAALQKYQALAAQYENAMKEYVAKYGPILQTQVTGNQYTWLKNPWPWDYTERNGGR